MTAPNPGCQWFALCDNPATDDCPAWTSWGFDTIEKAREHNREMTVPPETPGTILRRYVTTPEEA